MFFIIFITASLLFPMTVEEADQLWLSRDQGSEGPVASAETAQNIVDAYRGLLQTSPKDLSLRWKLMRALYFQGRYTGQSVEEQQATFSDAIALGEKGFELIQKEFQADPDDKPEKIAAKLKGNEDALHLYFYQSVAWGQWALAFGKMKAVRKGAASKIRDYSTVCVLADKTMESAGPLRVLGRLHHQTPRVPFITGWASNKDAMKYLKEAVSLGPENPMNKLFLAELLLDEDEPQQAKELLTEIASISPRLEYQVEDADTSMEAARLLKTIKK